MYFSHYQFVRKFIGGKWARYREEGYQWISWNLWDLKPEHLDMIGWPLNEKEFESEDWS